MITVLAAVALIIISSMQAPKADPGEDLAKQYCSSCHQFPHPDLLTKKSWNYLLTDMGFRLGIIDYGYLQESPPAALFSMTARQQILNAGGLIPAEPLISDQQWKDIRTYYGENAPQDPLPQAEKPPLQSTLPNFRLKVPGYQPKGAVLTLTRIDETDGKLILGNQRQGDLILMDGDLQTRKEIRGYELLVDEEVWGDTLFLLSIGDLMGQHVGVTKGTVLRNQLNALGPGQPTQVLSGLLRPADMEFADLTGNGRQELIICNFGDVGGNVSIYEQHDGRYELGKELIKVPGAIRSQAHDFDKDGLPDLAVLFGDANENISIFFNRGNLVFERKIVVETPATYGHTYFELQDFNDDGHMDLLVTNGDTDADPFNTLKNYHGTRIFLNSGKNDFNLAYFYPMYGAHFAKAADFDQDGDLDIAISAFFPDFSLSSPEQFTYLENTGNLNFKAFTHKETYKGRWMTMDVGDYDQDGDIDIVLGAGYLPLGMSVEYRDKLKKLREEGKALLVFENIIHP